MCIAIVKPAGKWVSEESLFNSFQANPHGAGYAYYNEATRTVIVKKGYFTFEEFKKEYMEDVTIDTPAFAHFRIATAGKKDASNCHPYLIDSGVLMHNGPCLNRDHCKGDKDRSDTWQFADDMMKHLSIENIRAIKPMIEDFIGYEKVAFLFADGTHMIANEKQGMWSEGCWYSNSSFRGYFQDSGKAYRDGSYASAYANNYEKGWQSGAQKNAQGTQTTSPSDIMRAIGMKKELFRCVWSYAIKAFVPRDIQIENYHLKWMEKFSAFVPDDVVNELSWDKVHVYEATPEAMAKSNGPHYKTNEDWVIVADCIKNDAELRVFLADALPWVSPEEKLAAEEKAAKALADKEADAKKASEKSTALTVEKSPDPALAEKAGAAVH